MNISTALIGIASLPMMGMALAASALASQNTDFSRDKAPAAYMTSDTGATCRTEASNVGQYRKCGAGSWSKAQSAYR